MQLPKRSARFFTSFALNRPLLAGHRRCYPPASFSSCPPDAKHEHCWHCQKLLDCIEEKFFCSGCEIIQPPVKCVNFFQYLDFPTEFNVPVDELYKRHKSLQMLLHPDRFGNKSKQEQEFSESQSSVVNKAYWTLAKPFSRIKYMLKLKGYNIEENSEIKDPEFLMEIMELNEKVDETSDIEQLQSVRENLESKCDEFYETVAELLDKNDYDAAKDSTLKINYYSRLIKLIDDKLPLSE